VGKQGPEYTRYNDFSEGQNDTVNDAIANPRAASLARNIDLDRDGAIAKRKGANELHTGMAGSSSEIGMIAQFRPSAGVEKKLLAYATRVAEWDGATGVTDLITGFTANKLWIPTAFKNFMYLSNDTDPPCVYWPGAPATPAAPSGAHRYLFRPGAPQPASALADGGAVAGNISTAGVIKARVRWLSVEGDEFFGEPFPEAGRELTISGEPTGWKLSNCPVYNGVVTPNYRIAKRAVERTTVGGGIFYLDGYIDDNTGTDYDFVDDDYVLIAKNVGPNPGWRIQMPVLYPTIKHKNRIVGADPSDIGSIIWSEIDEYGLLPSFFPESYQIYLDIEDEGDAPVAVARFGEYLVFYCGRSLHQVYIDEGGTAYARRLGNFRLGFPNARCVVELPGGHLLWSYKGPYFFNGNDLIFIGERIETEIRENISKLGLADMYVIHRSQERRRQVKFVFPSASGTENNFSAKYHYRRVTLNPEGFPTAHAWTFDDGFSAKSGAIMLDVNTNEEIEYSGTYDGKLYQEDTTDSDEHDTDGKIDGRWRTRWLDMNTPHLIKDFEELTLVMAGDPAKTINIVWEVEWGQGASGGAGVMAAGGSDAAVFGVAKFGEDRFFGGDTFERQIFLSQDGVAAQGRRIRLTFSNSEADSAFTILEMIFKWSIRRDRGDAPS